SPKAARYDIPDQAQEVCFSRSASAMAVEFTLSAADFRHWITEGHPHDERWQTPLEPISSTYEIKRYWKGNRVNTQLPTAKINRGLYLEWKASGNSLQVAYDEDACKVYL